MEKFFSVTIDLDTLAEDLSAGGTEESRAFLRRASYEKALPRIMGLLEKNGVKATFFLVASHLEDPACFSRARLIAEAGHEIASHGWSHDRGLPARESGEIKKELALSSEAIKKVSGLRPEGFRAPGAVATPELLKALLEAGYTYDSSYNPSFIYNFSKKVYSVFNANRFPVQEALSGSRGDGVFRSEGLLEYPVTVSGFMTLPLMNFFMMKLGGLGLKIIKKTAGRKKFVNYIIHDHELLSLEDLPGGVTGGGGIHPSGQVAGLTSKYLKTPLSARTGFLDSALKLLKAGGKVLPLGEISYNLKKQAKNEGKEA